MGDLVFFAAAGAWAVGAFFLVGVMREIDGDFSSSPLCVAWPALAALVIPLGVGFGFAWLGRRAARAVGRRRGSFPAATAKERAR